MPHALAPSTSNFRSPTIRISGLWASRQLQAAHSLPDHVRLAPVPHGRAARHNSQRRREAELLANGHTQALRLGGGQSQHIAPGLQPGAQVRHAGGGHVLKLADRLVPLPEGGDGLRGPLRRKSRRIPRRSPAGGGPMNLMRGALRRHRLPQLVKGIPQAVEDALPWSLSACRPNQKKI